MRKFILWLPIILCCCEKETLQKQPVQESVSNIAVDTNATLWFSTSLGLTHLNIVNSVLNWNNFSISAYSINVNDIRSFYSNGDEFDILTNKGYLQYNTSTKNPTTAIVYNKSTGGFGSDTILSILKQDNSLRWVLTTKSISVYQNNKWFQPTNSYVVDTLFSSFAVSNETCYVATKAWGVYRFVLNADAFTGASTYFNGFGCPINDTVYSVYIAKNKVQWYGTQEGVYTHDTTDFKSGWSWAPYTTKNGLPNNKVTLLTQDNQGRIWAGTPNGAAYFIGGTSWISYNSANVTNIISDKAGNVWIATTNGLVCFNGSWTVYNTTNGLSGNIINSLATTADGSIWVATENGATQIKNGKFTIYRSITQNN